MSRRFVRFPPSVGPSLSKAAAAELLVLLRAPRPGAKAEGAHAFVSGEPCRYDVGTPEAINWKAGWDAAAQDAE